MFEYSVQDVLEKTAIRSNPTNAVSKSDNDIEIVTAEKVLSSLALGDLELQEKQITEEENIDETLERLPEFLDKSTGLVLPRELEDIDRQTNAYDLKTLGDIFDQLKNGEIDLKSACSIGVLKRVQDTLNHTKDKLARSRTANLWLMYIDLIGILKQFIKAEREGSWSLHLYSVSQMLPF